MFTLANRLGLAMLVVASALALGVPRSDAQQVPPVAGQAGAAQNQPSFNLTGMGTGTTQVAGLPFQSLLPSNAASMTSVGGFGAAGSIFSNPYASSGFFPGYNPFFYPSYLNDPFSGYLTGAAQVISSQAQFMSTQAQTDLMKEQRKQMALNTQRMRLDEWLYERNLFNNLPDPRDTERKFILHRSLNDPPLSEIVSGDALNSILANINRLQQDGRKPPEVPLDKDSLKQINVTSGERGNTGLLRNGGKLNWPLSLQAAGYEEERTRLTSYMDRAIRQAETIGQVDPKMLEQMRADLVRFREKINANSREMNWNQGIEARRYLGELEDALSALESPDVQNHFNGKWSARGDNVAELVKNMAGLRFAPATQGQEAAYRMLQQRLAQFNYLLDQQSPQK